MITIGEATGLRKVRKSCDRKKRFDSAADAATARSNMITRGISSPCTLQVYQCRFDPSHWHLGNAKEGQHGETERQH